MGREDINSPNMAAKIVFYPQICKIKEEKRYEETEKDKRRQSCPFHFG